MRRLRVEDWRDPHGEGPAAIERQPKFHLTSAEISNGGKRILPLNREMLAGMEYLANSRRKQGGGIPSRASKRATGSVK